MMKLGGLKLLRMEVALLSQEQETNMAGIKENAEMMEITLTHGKCI